MHIFIVTLIAIKILNKALKTSLIMTQEAKLKNLESVALINERVAVYIV